MVGLMENRNIRVKEAREILIETRDFLNYYGFPRKYLDNLTKVENVLEELQQHDKEHDLRLWKKFKIFFGGKNA